MIKKYNVIDIAWLYEGIPKKQMYLVLSRAPQNANCPRKIVISKKRSLSINYFEDEEVQVFVWDKAVGTYECEKVLIKGGQYRVNSIANMLFPEVRSKYFEDWNLVKDFFPYFTDALLLTDRVIVSKGTDSELRALVDVKVEESNLLLKRFECCAMNKNRIECLFNKCIRGEAVNLNDFQSIVDDVEGPRKASNVSIEFNNMIFEVNAIKKTISVQVLIGSQGKMNETVSFTISLGRVGGMPFFLLYTLAKIESVEDKMKYLTERIIY